MDDKAFWTVFSICSPDSTIYGNEVEVSACQESGLIAMIDTQCTMLDDWSNTIEYLFVFPGRTSGCGSYRTDKIIFHCFSVFIQGLVDVMSTVRQWLSRARKMANGKKSTHEVTIPTSRDREELVKILNPIYLVTAFIGYKNKHHPYLNYIGLPLWVFNLAVHFSLDFYEASHIFGWAWATAMAVFFVSFCTGTYAIIKNTIPWLEDALEILHVEGNFTETLEKMQKVAKVRGLVN